MRCARTRRAIRRPSERPRRRSFANPKLDVAEVISKLGVGEALVSTLQENGVPMPVERTMMAPPRCRMGAITAEERAAVRARSPIGAQVRPRRESRVGVRDAVEARAGSGCDFPCLGFAGTGVDEAGTE